MWNLLLLVRPTHPFFSFPFFIFFRGGAWRWAVPATCGSSWARDPAHSTAVTQASTVDNTGSLTHRATREHLFSFFRSFVLSFFRSFFSHPFLYETLAGGKALPIHWRGQGGG